MMAAFLRACVSSEMEAQLRRVCPWSNEVRPTEGRQEVVECGFVRQVDDGKSQTPLMVIAVKEVVIADGSVKQMSRRDACWIMV